MVKCVHVFIFKEIDAILGEKLSAEDEEEVLAEFENQEAPVLVFHLNNLLSCFFIYLSFPSLCCVFLEQNTLIIFLVIFNLSLLI